MLTPRVDDPNRDSELKRREKDPVSFGAVHDYTVSEKLKAIKAQAGEQQSK